MIEKLKNILERRKERRESEKRNKQVLDQIAEKHPYKDETPSDRVQITSVAILAMADSLKDLKKRDEKKAIVLGYWAMCGIITMSFGQENLLKIYSAYQNRLLEEMGIISQKDILEQVKRHMDEMQANEKDIDKYIR